MARRAKELRLTQLEEFLGKVDSCRGEFSHRKKRELGKHFLEVVMGLEDEFIACKSGKESPDFEPRSERLYPWALFVTDKEDLRQEYDHRASSYLHPDKVGEEFHAVITNGEELCVFDFNHEVTKYTVLFAELVSGNAKDVEHWQAFLADFGQTSTKKTARRGSSKSIQRHSLWLVKSTREVQDNIVYMGENLRVMKTLKAGKIDFIYIDPPFCAQSVKESKAWGKKLVSFNDEWIGGIDSYIKWLIPRLRECHRLLKETGVLCLHLDQRSVHYAKIELDKIFGKNSFVNEIIWCYTGPSNSKRYFPRKHDTILVYSRSKNFVFNFEAVRVPYKKLETGKTSGIFKANATLSDKGKVIEDWWPDCSPVGRIKNERVGYPTQKPLSLLNRLIKAFTSKGDLVFDAFCGCGTTISSAQKLNRRWLGIDVSKDAIDVIKDRMVRDHNLKIKIIQEDSLSKNEIMSLSPFDFERHMVSLIGGTPNMVQRRDGGVDGYTYDHIPIQVKKSYSVGRPVIDSFLKHIQKRGAGIVIAHSFSKDAHEEVARLENEHGYTVYLMHTRDLMRDAS